MSSSTRPRFGLWKDTQVGSQSTHNVLNLTSAHQPTGQVYATTVRSVSCRCHGSAYSRKPHDHPGRTPKQAPRLLLTVLTGLAEFCGGQSFYHMSENRQFGLDFFFEVLLKSFSLTEAPISWRILGRLWLECHISWFLPHGTMAMADFGQTDFG